MQPFQMVPASVMKFECYKWIILRILQMPVVISRIMRFFHKAMSGHTELITLVKFIRVTDIRHRRTKFGIKLTQHHTLTGLCIAQAADFFSYVREHERP